MPRTALALLAFLFCTTHAAAELRHFGDATLRAVQFIDDKEGWAVGDDGVVLHTLDGGKSWARQPTGLRASLRSVFFLTPEVGWIAGREEQPHAGSVGVLLFTRDGGLKWQKQLPGTLPGLNQVRFIDAQTGYLLGDGCDQFPSGVFKTIDGGKAWEPVAGPRTTTWHAADFLNQGKTGLFAGGWARLGMHAADKFNIVDDVQRTEGRDIRGLQILPERALAVAQGGLILTSVSGGAKWGYADLKLPTDLLACLDFHAIHATGAKVWVVGRPGSVVLHSADAGVSWQLQRTGQSCPLQSVYFFDETYGWAVGELGTIVATQDGGKTWKTQRQGGKRAAVLVVHARNQDLAVDTLTALGASEGYLATSLRVVAPDPESARLPRAAEPMRYGAAVRQSGGVTGETLWAFSLPRVLEGGDRAQIMEHWNRRHAQEAPRELLRQLVLALRIWRPSVVLGDHAESKNALSAMLGEALTEAVRQAADAKAFPEQMDQLGLETWQVSKVYAPGDKASAPVVQDNERIVGALQMSLGDYAESAASLLNDRPNPLPRERHYRVVQSLLPAAQAENHWLTGVDIPEGEARRTLTAEQPLAGDVEMALKQKRQLLSLAEQLDDPQLLQTHVMSILAKMPEEHAATAAFAVASRFAGRGRWELARETYATLPERFPTHPLSAEACRWLLRHGTSSETRRRSELKQSVVRADVKVNGARPGFGEPIQLLGGNQTSEKRGIVLTKADERNDLRATLEMGQRLAAFGPLVASEPGMQFCLQAARRQLGETDKALDWYAKFAQYIPQGPWHDAAQAELWLAGRGTQAPRKLAKCRLTDTRPHLDGNFDDPCWQNLRAMTLDQVSGDTRQEYPTQAWFAYDNEFFYVALKCKHPAGKKISPVKVRPRDADLDAFDRVSLLFDLDRDYATCFRLEVDQRGCVREDCWGDAEWNPRWFVAAKSTDDCWQIEAAIPLGELSSKRIDLNSAWAFNVVRIIPGQGVQSWSQPADVEPRPEGLSLLQFYQDSNRGGSPMPPP